MIAPRRIALLLGLCLVAPTWAQAQETLGRLFFTPERRALLERQRQFNVQEARMLEGGSMSLDGVVARSSGKRTVWVSGRAQHDAAMPTGVAATLDRRTPGSAVLSAGDEAPARLSVGESINRATREKTDALGGGQARVARPAAP